MLSRTSAAIFSAIQQNFNSLVPVVSENLAIEQTEKVGDLY